MDFPIGGLTGGMLKMNLLVNVLYVSDLSRSCLMCTLNYVHNSLVQQITLCSKCKIYLWPR